jgi:hypothetical protein
VPPPPVSPQFSPPPPVAEAVQPAAPKPRTSKPQDAQATAKKDAPRRKQPPSQNASDRLPQSIDVAGEQAVVIPLSANDADDSSRLSASGLLLILSLAAAGLLLALAAIPRAWTFHYGFAARLDDIRVGLGMAGTLLLVESVLVALMLTR